MANIPPDGGRPKSDIGYHLHRLFESEEAGIDERTQAAHAIYRSRIHELKDDVLTQFLGAFDREENPGLRNQLACILARRWGTRTEVLQLMRSALNTGKLSKGLHSFYFLMGHRMMDNPALAKEHGIQEFVANAHEWLTRGSERDQGAAISLLQSWGFVAHVHELGEEKVDQHSIYMTLLGCGASESDTFRSVSRHLQSLIDKDQMEEWTRKLTGVVLGNHSSNPRLALSALKTLSLLQGESHHAIWFEKLRPAVMMGREEGEREADDYTESGDPLELYHQFDPPTLTPTEDKTLAKIVQEQSHTPTSLLAQFMRERPYVFLSAFTNEALRKLPGIVDVLKEESHLSHVAINIPAENEQHFRQFLAGNDPPEWRYALCGGDELEEFLYDKEVDLIREALRRIDKTEGIQWAFVGVPPNISPEGELALDLQAGKLARIREENPQAKVLLYGGFCLPFEQEISKTDLTSADDGSKHPSLACQLAKEVGRSCIACVLAYDTECRFDSPLEEPGEIGEFCRRHGIITSFGVHIQDTPLADKKFCTPSYLETYGETWDGLLVFVPKDGNDDRGHKNAPDPSLRQGVESKRRPCVKRRFRNV